jgi:hypothetical protein
MSIKITEKTLAKIVNEAVEEIKHNRECKGGNCDNKSFGDGKKRKMNPYKKEKYNNYDAEDDDYRMVNENNRRPRFKKSTISEAVDKTLKAFMEKQTKNE